MSKTLLLALATIALPVCVSADNALCPGTGITVKTDDLFLAELTCDAAEQALILFENCNIPPIKDPLHIEIVDSLDPGCVGQYHCGAGTIEVLAPHIVKELHAPESPFAFLPDAAYFQSIVVHELTHAAIADLSCPFDACVVAQEYLAYTMQIMSLAPAHQAAYSADMELDRHISRDELSIAILFMAPQVFAQKAWVHLSQREDPCAFVGQIVDGTVLLDRERFDF